MKRNACYQLAVLTYWCFAHPVGASTRYRRRHSERSLGIDGTRLSRVEQVSSSIVKATRRANTLSDHNKWCRTMSLALAEYGDSRSNQLWEAISSVVNDGDMLTHADEVTTWMRHNCSASLWSRFLDLSPYPTCERSAASQLQAAACTGYRACMRLDRRTPKVPHVAIMLGATSRTIAAPSTSNMALFTLALPSIAKTVECGFRYSVFIGYDAGDPFYDAAAGETALVAWFERHVHNPLQDRAIHIELVPVRVANPDQKPGPVFNAVAQRARSADADFFYRINDDTMMLTPWTAAFACALCSLGPPYGVVGPVETEHDDFLTHDFVHRTHVDIFGDYYPPSLSDWYMDNWISQVYGSSRSLRLASVKVSHIRPCVVPILLPFALFLFPPPSLLFSLQTLHMNKKHGQRYTVDKSHESLLRPLLELGRQRIQDYVMSRSAEIASEAGREFANNEFNNVRVVGK